MRIVVADYLGRAQGVQLSRGLAARGHDVLHLYSADMQSQKADLARRADDPPTFLIEGFSIGTPNRRGFFRVRFQERRFGARLRKRAAAFRPDVVMGVNNPLDVQRHLQAGAHGAGARFVYWLQEFYARNIERQLDQQHGAFLSIVAGGYYFGLQRSLLQQSDAIVPVTHNLLSILAEGWEIDDRQCMVVNNWAALPCPATPNAVANWKGSNGLAGKKVVLYTGSLDSNEDPELFVRVGERLKDHIDVRLVIVSEGPEAERIRSAAKARGLANIIVLPFQPYEIYQDVLACADVLIAALSSTAGMLSHPGKIASYLAAGRPIVLASPWQNVAASTIRDSGAGVVVAHGDDEATAAALLRFLSDIHLSQEISERAARYAAETFDIDKITGRFERLFQRICSGVPRRRQKQTVYQRRELESEPD